MTSRAGSARALRLGLSLVLPYVAIGALFVGGEFLERATRYSDGLRKPVRAAVDTGARLTDALAGPLGADRLASGDLPVYELRVGRNKLARLYDTIERVQAEGNSDDEGEMAYERARFRAGGGWVPIRIKLRGWASNHFNKAHPSIRLRFPAERPFHGRRQINLVDPYDKFLTADVTTAREAARHGLISWEGRFVVLRVNGEIWGIYLEIEQPRRELVEHHDRPEGPVLSPNGNFYGPQAPGHERAAAALERLQPCLDPASAVEDCDWELVRTHFDTDRLAWAAAIMGLSGHWGAWLKDNLRLYFDPARGSFEPIPWDYGFLPLSVEPAEAGEVYGTPPPGTILEDGEALAELGVTLMRLPQFRRMRDERLWELATVRAPAMQAWARDLFRAVEPSFEEGRRELGAGPARRMHERFLETLERNAALLRRLLSAHDLSLGVPATGEGLRVDNAGKAAVKIRSLRLAAGGERRDLQLPEPVTVPGRWARRPGSALLSVALPAGATVVGIAARNLATGEAVEPEAVRLAGTAIPPTATPPARQVPAELDLPRGARLAGGIVRLGPGRVELTRTLELPEGIGVRLEPGLDLRLGAGVSLIVHGDLEARGRERARVLVGPADPQESWGTLAVQGRRLAPARVALVHATIRGGAGGAGRRVDYSGSLSVHDGTVLLRDVRLESGRGEDGINLKYATFLMEDSLVQDQAGDGLDLDFCRGAVRRSSLLRAGGDAIDLSGSAVVLEDDRIEEIGDKGVSIGERTMALVRDLRVAAGLTGVAVKDDSLAEITGLRLRDTQVGIGAYVKKPSFGHGAASVRDATMTDVASPYRVASASALQIEQRPE